MPFTHDDLVARFPFLFHTTTSANADDIESTGSLISAQTLMTFAGWSPTDARRLVRRRARVPLTIDGRTTTLMDQGPLHAGHIAFEEGWDLARFIERLNELVFFWPGDSAGPIEIGGRHRERYVRDHCVTLRVSTAALLRANAPNAPFFSRANSGAPRTSAGVHAPRGSATFVRPPTFPLSRLCEVVFEHEVLIPAPERWVP